MRVNQRGNRQLNYSLHFVAITQLRYPCEGRNYYDRKRAEGKNTKEAIRAVRPTDTADPEALEFANHCSGTGPA